MSAADAAARRERLAADIVETMRTTTVMEQAIATLALLRGELERVRADRDRAVRLGEAAAEIAEAGAAAHADLLRLLAEINLDGDGMTTTDGAILVAELRGRWVAEPARPTPPAPCEVFDATGPPPARLTVTVRAVAVEPGRVQCVARAFLPSGQLFGESPRAFLNDVDGRAAAVHALASNIIRIRPDLIVAADADPDRTCASADGHGTGPCEREWGHAGACRFPVLP